MGATVKKLNIMRLLSVVLSLVLMLSCVPSVGFAEQSSWIDAAAPDGNNKLDDSDASEEQSQWMESDSSDDYVWAETEEFSDSNESDDSGNSYAYSRFFPDYTLEMYSDVMYASGTILDNGCSVVCLASLATYMTGHQYYPDELAKYFGGYGNNNVERLRYMSDMLELPYVEAKDYRDVVDALYDGKVVIQLVNKRSLFTKSQHFIMIKGFKENGLLDVFDPSEKNRDSWHLIDKFENGFTQDEICWGYDGAWIYDPAQMPENPYIYQEPVREYVEPRYTDLYLTAEETKLLARLVWVESRGESPEGQQAVAEAVLNRFVSGRFGSSISAMINDESQFVPRKLLKSAKPGQAQYEAIDRALYGPYLLPKDVMFYGRVRTTKKVWGNIGAHIFCFPNDYEGEGILKEYP